MMRSVNLVRRLTALVALALTLIACTDPTAGDDPGGALRIVEGASVTFTGLDSAGVVTLRHDRSVNAPLDWAFDAPARVRATPASGRLNPGERVTIDIDVDRSGLTAATTLQGAFLSGARGLGVTFTLDVEPVIAPCDPDPAVRYAGVRAAPLDVAAAAFAAAGVAPTGVLIGSATHALPVPAGVVTTAFRGGFRLASDDPLALARSLQDDPRVRWIELDGPILTLDPTPALVVTGDPYYDAGEQWWLDAFGYAAARAAPSGAGASVTVAVIDTGIEIGHQDLVGALVPGYSFIDYANGGGGGSTLDALGHGTHVAGLIAARADDGIGIAGIAGHADVRVQPIRVFDAQGRTTFADVAASIRWAAGLPPTPDDGTTPSNARADVINLSLGGSVPSAAIHEAAIDARCAGSLLVAAAGNGIANVGRRDGVFYPARHPEVFAVGSVDENGVRSVFSDYGEGMLDAMAAGGVMVPDRGACAGRKGLLSTYRGANDAYACLRGTSMATPQVSGMAALLITREPARFRTGDAIGVARLEALLRRAAALRPGGDPDEYGHGILCLDAVLGVSGCSTTAR